MAVSKALRRLLQTRGLEEEQRRLALESAVSRLHGLMRARDAAGVRERDGRALAGSAVVSGDLADRQAGHVEAEAARKIRRMLAPRIEATAMETARLRQDFLDKRVQRRQAETLIEEIETQEAAASGRREQQELDDGDGSRKHREHAETGSR